MPKPAPDLDARLAADPELIRIERARDDLDGEREALGIVLGAAGALELDDGRVIPLPPVTPGGIALLQYFESPLLLKPEEPATETAARTALYVLIRGRGAAALDAAWLDRQAADWFGPASPPADLTRRLVRQQLAGAFRPYRQLPPPSTVDEEEQPYPFGQAWLCGLAVRVATVTHLTPETVIWRLSMAAAAAYDVEYRRLVLRLPGIHRRKKPDPKLIRAWFDRFEEIHKEFAQIKKD